MIGGEEPLKLSLKLQELFADGLTEVTSQNFNKNLIRGFHKAFLRIGQAVPSRVLAIFFV